MNIKMIQNTMVYLEMKSCFCFVKVKLRYINMIAYMSNLQLILKSINLIQAKRLAWNVTNERQCGRPLGSRLIVDANKQTLLFILDAYHGLFEINIGSKQITHHISGHSKLTNIADEGNGYSNTSRYDPVVSLPIKFFNDLDILIDPISQDKIVVFTDSSYKYTRSENRMELLDGAPRGRLFHYNLANKKLSVLLCGLHFANGVQQVPSGNRKKSRFVLVAETTRFRILKVNYDLLLQSLFTTTGSPMPGSKVSANSNNNHIKWNLLESCGEDGSLSSYLTEQKRVQSYAPPGGDPNHLVSHFLEEMTGVVDNIRLNTLKRFNTPDTLDHDSSDAGWGLFVGAGTKSAKPFSFLLFAYQNTWLRDIVGKFVKEQTQHRLFVNILLHILLAMQLYNYYY